jgi:hypothetical protein
VGKGVQTIVGGIVTVGVIVCPKVCVSVSNWLGVGDEVAVNDGAIVKLGDRCLAVEAVTSGLHPHVMMMAIKIEIPASLFIIHSCCCPRLRGQAHFYLANPSQGL